jgi:SAM-dependent methyltransferase
MSSVMENRTTIDANKSEAFAGKMIGALNTAGVVLMTSIGHRTGLFDTMASLPPSTSERIAEAAKLNERYVREWLGAMVTGGIVEYDAEAGRYALPPEHAAWLTRAASPNNLAVPTQFIPVLAAVEDAIVGCFRNGGGVPYSSFHRFHEVMAEESAQTVVAALFDHILPLVDGLTGELERGIQVLDVGCGSGRALVTMARAFPNSRFFGYDLSPEATAVGRAQAAALGLTNVELSVRDVTALDDRGRFDLITAFDAIHDQVRPAAVLAGIARSLKPGGAFLMQDIAGSSHVHENMNLPLAPMLYAISCMHCMTVSLASGGDGLGTMWGEDTALAMLADAGFGSVDVHRLPHDVMNCFYVARR